MTLRDDVRGASWAGRPRRLEHGEVITRQGDIGETLYLVTAGAVRLASVTPDGREVVVALLGTGDVFGECALLERPSPVEARAVGQADVVAIPVPLLGEIVEHRPAIAEQLLRLAASRLHRTSRALEQALVEDVPTRVSRRLRDLAEEHGTVGDDGVTIGVPLTQEELGRMVGASRETVNRTLRGMTARGLVRTYEHTVVIPDPTALEPEPPYRPDGSLDIRAPCTVSLRMDDYGPSTYGERIAEAYDARYEIVPSGGDLPTAVAFLKELARDGAALELGIGTGRVALPLSAAGVRVHGIDASQAMVARLRAKPGETDIPVTMGDFREFDLREQFRLIYVVFNTFFGLLTQDDQVSCFRSVARHLTDDGVFAMEAFVPDLTRYERGQRVSATRVELDEVEIEVSQHDALAQRTRSHHLIVREDGVRLYPVRIRYSYPPELDLMARLAGMRLRERWADWDRSPLTATSQKHISVWELDRPGT